MTEQNRLSATKRQLDMAAGALAQPGCGAIANLECRVADLQQHFLATPAATLGDVVVRLEAIREIVVALGEPGYLLHLVDAAIGDVRAIAAASSRE